MYLCFVDDGSTDNTLDLLEVVRKQFPDRVLIIPLAQNRERQRLSEQVLSVVFRPLSRSLLVFLTLILQRLWLK